MSDMRSKFSAIQREHSPNPRKFYAFCTSVTDTATTAGIIASGKLWRLFILVCDLLTTWGSSLSFSEGYGDTTIFETVKVSMTSYACYFLVFGCALYSFYQSHNPLLFSRTSTVKIE